MGKGWADRAEMDMFTFSWSSKKGLKNAFKTLAYSRPECRNRPCVGTKCSLSIPNSEQGGLNTIYALLCCKYLMHSNKQNPGSQDCRKSDLAVGEVDDYDNLVKNC